MQTRTKRWLVIAVASVVPIVTVATVVGELDEPNFEENAVAMGPCADLAALWKIDAEVARARTDAVVALDETSPERMQCAAELIHRSKSGSTVVEDVARAADGAFEWALRSARLDTQVSLSTGKDASRRTAIVVLTLNVIAILIALRQLQLWRGERQPGPVLIQDVPVPKDDEKAVNLATVLRTTLGDAGIAPGVAAPGELSAVIIDAATDLTAADPKSLAARAIAGLTRVLAPPAGYTVSAVAYRRADSRCAVSLEVKVARTSATYDNVDGEGASYVEAAENAAYELYLRLVARSAVARRTPVWLAWGSADSLRAYRGARRETSPHKAVEALAALKRAEPANALVLLASSDRWWQRAWVSVDEVALGAAPVDTKAVLAATEDALAVLHRARRHDEALLQAGIALAYAEVWQGGWGAVPAADRARFAASLERAVVSTSWWRWRWPVSPTIASADLGEVARDAASILLRTSVRNQRYWVVARRWWPLAARREQSERATPFSRMRFTYRHVALALLDATAWDRERLDRHGRHWRRTLAISSVRRGRVKAGRLMRHRSHLAAEYDLAIAYAAEARAHQARVARPPFAGTPRHDAERHAAASLRKALLGPDARLTATDIDALLQTPEVAAALRVRPMFAPLVDPLIDETLDARRERIWTERHDVIDETVTAGLAFNHRKRRALGALWWWDLGLNGRVVGQAADEVAEWFSKDAELWTAFSTWLSSPSEATLAKLAKARAATDPGTETPGAPSATPSSGGEHGFLAVRTKASGLASAAGTAEADVAALVSQRWWRGRIEAAAAEAADRWMTVTR